MKVILFSFLSLSLASCGVKKAMSEPEPLNYTYVADTELLDVTANILDRINIRFGTNYPISKIRIVDTLKRDIIGTCYLDSGNIYIRRDIRILMLPYVLLHELGHCLFGLYHTEDQTLMRADGNLYNPNPLVLNYYINNLDHINTSELENLVKRQSLIPFNNSSYCGYFLFVKDITLDEALACDELSPLIN